MDSHTGNKPPAHLEFRPVSDHELCASCMGVERACATTAKDAGAEAHQEAKADTPGTAGKRKHCSISRFPEDIGHRKLHKIDVSIATAYVTSSMHSRRVHKLGRYRLTYSKQSSDSLALTCSLMRCSNSGVVLGEIRQTHDSQAISRYHCQPQRHQQILHEAAELGRQPCSQQQKQEVCPKDGQVSAQATLDSPPSP